MVEFFVTSSVRHFVTNGRHGHIESLELRSTRHILLFADKLDASDARILPRILGESLCLTQVVNARGVVRLKDIDDVTQLVVTTYHKKVGVGGLVYCVNFVGDAKRPRPARGITNPAHEAIALLFFGYNAFFPAVQLDARNTGVLPNKKMRAVVLTLRIVRHLDGLGKTEVVFAYNVAIGHDTVILAANLV